MAKEKTRVFLQSNTSLLSKLDLISLLDSMTLGVLFVDQPAGLLP